MLGVKAKPLRGRYARLDPCARRWRLARHGVLVSEAAQLNMGDCFAYACARAQNAPLLFKGEDFLQTDINDAER